MVLPIIRERLVEAGVLLIRHVLRLAHPKRLVLVQLFPLMGHLLDLLGLLLLLLLLLLLVHLLNLWLVTLGTLLLLLLLLLFRVGHLLLLGLLHVELDWEANELRVLLYQVLEAALLEELGLVLLQVADDLRAT